MTPTELERLAFLRFAPGSLERCLLDSTESSLTDSDREQTWNEGFDAGKEEQSDDEEALQEAYDDGVAEATAKFERHLEEAQQRVAKLELHVQALESTMSVATIRRIRAELGQ
jgi:flagellar biosynthesis/type III secretory pathway protein FliH